MTQGNEHTGFEILPSPSPADGDCSLIFSKDISPILLHFRIAFQDEAFFIIVLDLCFGVCGAFFSRKILRSVFCIFSIPRTLLMFGLLVFFLGERWGRQGNCGT